MNFKFWPNERGWISNFDPLKRGEFWIVSRQKGEILNFVLTKRGFRILSQQNGDNFEFWPSYIIKITNFPLFIGSFFKRSSLRSQTILSFKTFHLAYPKLVGTPCIYMSFNVRINFLPQIIFTIFARFFSLKIQIF